MTLMLHTLAAFVLLTSSQSSASQSRDPAQELIITAVGDINMGTDFPSKDYLPPDSNRSLFAPVKHLLSGDVVFGNLEGPLLDGGRTQKCKTNKNCYAFRTPTRFATHLKKAGFTVVSLANNHALDFGQQGRKSTQAQLDLLGIAHSGALGDVASFTVKGKKIGLIAFTTYSHSYNILDKQAAEHIAKVSATHDLTLVSFHAGAEGSRTTHVPDKPEFLGREPRGHVIQFSHAAIDAGADLVIGHGPHVVRGIEIYKGRLIAYSLGNFHTYGRFNLSGALGLAVVLNVTLDAKSGEFRLGKLYAVKQKKPGGAQPDPRQAGIKLIRKLTQEDFPYTGVQIAPDGTISADYTMGYGLFGINSAKHRSDLSQLLKTLEKRTSRRRLVQTFGDKRARLNRDVIKQFANPAEKIHSYKKYRTMFITPEIIQAGKNFMKEKQRLLSRIESKYKVERQAVLGIVATETKFGNHKGNYRVFNVLATQALLMEGRKRWATDELDAFFRVFRKNPIEVMGSYAGAVGLVQFMPTSILRYGQDWQSDKSIDLDEWQDALASCANYLRGKGWKWGQPIKKGSTNYTAFYRYNPSHHYARVVSELTYAFGYGKKEK